MAREANVAIPVSLRVEHAKSEPLAHQVYRALREAVLEGTFPPLARLPSTRALAAALRVSRNTVLFAFDQLTAEGYLEARRGSGTRVLGTIPEELLSARAGGGSRPSPAPPVLSKRAAALLRVPVHSSPYVGPPRPFRVGAPALHEFPMETWGRIAHRRWAKTSEAALDYGDPQGTPRLRRAIAGYLRTARGVDAAPEQVLVLSSAQQALDLVARVLLDPGDALWMEDPGYPGARGAFVASGARLVPIPVDEEGLDVAKGEQLAPKARLAYVTPSHQFPLGATMSLPRRLRLLEWAHRAKAWIVEDDYDSEFRYVDRPLAALQGLDTHGRVLYAGTFSKVLFPSLRLAYLVLPPSLVGAFRAARYFSDGQPPAASQAVVTAFIEEGHFERHIRRMRVLCAERQKALVTTCARHLAGLLHVAPADGGMNLVGWLPEGSDDRAAAEAAARNEVEVIPLSALSRRRTKRPGLFLGYSAFRPREIEEGALRLRDALLSLRRHATG